MPTARKIAQTIANDCVAHRARQAARLLTRKYEDAVRPLGIQVSQLSLLVAAASAGESGAPLGKIARALHMDQTTVSRNVAPLVKSGLLALTRSPHDARSRLVVLTAAGERTLQAAYPRWKAVQRGIAEVLEAEGCGDFHAQLGAVLGLAEQL